MKPEQIFVGNIRKCTKYEEYTTFSSSMYNGNECVIRDSIGTIATDDEIYKKQAILIKMKNGGYVDLERLNSILDSMKVYRDITKDGYRLGGLIMSTSAYCMGCLFVEEESLKPYYNYSNKQQISVYQLKKQIKRDKKFKDIIN